MRIKKIVVIGTVVWVSCAVFNFGALNAYMKYDDWSDSNSRQRSQRDELGFIAFECCLLSPIQIVSTLVITNFCQHGWTLENWKAAEPKKQEGKSYE